MDESHTLDMAIYSSVNQLKNQSYFRDCKSIRSAKQSILKIATATFDLQIIICQSFSLA